MTSTPTADPNIEAETELQLTDRALADLGALHRRAGCETLTEADFRALTTRMRQRLRRLRALHLEALETEGPLELTDAAAAVASAEAAGRSPDVQALLRRIPALMTAQQLADHPEVTRARFHGAFAVVDGGCALEEARP